MLNITLGDTVEYVASSHGIPALNGLQGVVNGVRKVEGTLWYSVAVAGEPEHIWLVDNLIKIDPPESDPVQE